MDSALLDQARKEIDRINSELTALLVERMKQVDLVAQWKAANDQPIHVPAREEAVIARVRELAGEEFADDVEAVFRGIFAASCVREERKIHGKKEELL